MDKYSNRNNISTCHVFVFLSTRLNNTYLNFFHPPVMASGFRVPQIDLGAILQADHPVIDLRLESYENETRSFLQNLARFKDLAITQETEERAAFVVETKRLAEKSAEIEAETNQCKVREIELLAGASFVC